MNCGAEIPRTVTEYVAGAEGQGPPLPRDAAQAPPQEPPLFRPSFSGETPAEEADAAGVKTPTGDDWFAGARTPEENAGPAATAGAEESPAPAEGTDAPAGGDLFAGASQPEENAGPNPAPATEDTRTLAAGTEAPSGEDLFAGARTPEENAAPAVPVAGNEEPPAAGAKAPAGEDLFAGASQPEENAGPAALATEDPHTPAAGTKAPAGEDLFAGARPPEENAGPAPGAEAPPVRQGPRPGQQNLLGLMAEAEAGPPPGAGFQLPAAGGFDTYNNSMAGAGRAAAPAGQGLFPAQAPPPYAQPAYAPPAPPPPGRAAPRGGKGRKRGPAPGPGAPKSPQQTYEEDMTQPMPAADPAFAAPRRAAPPPPVLLPEPEPGRRHSLAGRIFTWFAILILFVVLTMATALTMLWFQNRPSKTVDAFIEAVAAGDVAALQAAVELEGDLAPSQEEWYAFCAAFAQESEQNLLKSQLLQMAEDPQAQTAPPYAAVGMQSEDFLPVLSFIQQYRVTISPVSLFAAGAQAGTVVRLGTVDHTGAPHTAADGAAGELYQNLMPGRYACKVVPPGVDAASISTIEIEIFGIGEPNLLAGTQPHANVTVQNCLSDDAVIYVNEVPVTDTPVGGVVNLSNVPLGATIRIVLVQDGVAMQASVVFGDLTATTLRFDNYAPQDASAPPSVPAAPSASSPAQTIGEGEINSLLATFYASYLECINQQGTAPLQLATDSAKNGVAARIVLPDNAANQFQYGSAAVKADSIQNVEGAAVPTVRFNARFAYQYRPRDTEDAWVEGATQYTIELVYQNGQWLVNKMNYVSAGDYDNNVYAE